MTVVTVTALTAAPANPLFVCLFNLPLHQWVARDASGHRLVNRAPFITHHPPSQAALAAGQPVPMTCCWNGLAVLSAQPFLAGLRFRAGLPGECRGSECR